MRGPRFYFGATRKFGKMISVSVTARNTMLMTAFRRKKAVCTQFKLRRQPDLRVEKGKHRAFEINRPA